MGIIDNDGRASMSCMNFVQCQRMLALTDLLIHSVSNVLQNRKATLLEADGGVQKVRSVIRALLRMDKDRLEPNQITEDSKPSDVLKYIADQIESAQKHEERPEQIEKVIKRLKKLVKNDNVSVEHVMLSSFFAFFNVNGFLLRLTQCYNLISPLHTAPVVRGCSKTRTSW